MTIAAALEANLRARCVRNLPAITDRMVEDTRAVCSRRSGTLAESIGADPWQDEGSRFTSTIRATAPYAIYQELGTGVYGPGGGRIYPHKPGGVLAFEWPAAGGMVFARSVAGSPGRHFFYGESGTAMRDRFENAFAQLWGP